MLFLGTQLQREKLRRRIIGKLYYTSFLLVFLTNILFDNNQNYIL
jgi:hypothetical protein